jgi:hypothetical protein
MKKNSLLIFFLFTIFLTGCTEDSGKPVAIENYIIPSHYLVFIDFLDVNARTFDDARDLKSCYDIEIYIPSSNRQFCQYSYEMTIKNITYNGNDYCLYSDKKNILTNDRHTSEFTIYDKMEYPPIIKITSEKLNYTTIHTISDYSTTILEHVLINKNYTTKYVCKFMDKEIANNLTYEQLSNYTCSSYNVDCKN